MTGKRQEKLLQHSILLLAATQVSNIANLLFQVVMGRAMSANAAEYGVLITMLTVGHVFGQPIDALRTALAHFTARLTDDGHRGDVVLLAKKWIKIVLLVSLPAVVLGVVFSSYLSSFFKLSDPTPIILTITFLACMPCLAIVVGVLQGLQSFIWMSVVQHGWAVIRLIVGWSLVLLLSPLAVWGLTGQVFGIIISVLLGLLVLIFLLRDENPSGLVRKSSLEFRYIILSMLVLMGFALLMNADLLLIKHFFHPDEAGIYARAAVIGRTVIFLPMPIAAAMFPKVVSGGGMSSGDRKTLMMAILYSMGIILTAAIACLLFPKIPLYLLYGDRNPTDEIVHLVRMVVLAMSPLGLTYLVMNFELAQHRFKMIGAMSLCAVIYCLAITIWHSQLLHIVAALGAVALLSATLLIAQMPWRKA